MKDKIQHISKGKFQTNKLDIVFPQTHLVLKIGEGETYRGSFEIENLVDGDIRGLIYSSSFRMKTKEPGFEGNPVTIEYTYDGHGLEPGHVEQGTFTIVCNGGEYTVSFSAIIEKPFLETSIGKIQDLRGFKKLAFTDLEEAQRIFKSRDFYELIKYEEPKIKYIYDHMRTWTLNSLGMEEFLVGIKQKEKIFLSLENKHRVFADITNDQSDVIVLNKNTWGYLEGTITVDGDFIEVDSLLFTSADFKNGELKIPYKIKMQELHLGNNFGKITITTAYETIEYLVEAHPLSYRDINKRSNDYIYAKLLKLYLQLESEKIDIELWFNKTTTLINDLTIAETESAKIRLYQAHACIIANKIEEAKWILENYNYNKYMMGRDIELDAYYLYLDAVAQQNHQNTKKSIDELNKIYMKNSKSWKVLCMMIQIDPYYHDYYERKQSLEAQYENGARNLIIYHEAYKTFKVKSSNLKKLGEFEIQVLRFATKYNMMTNELALYTANLASQQKNFDKRIFDLLTLAYSKLKDPMILNAICTLLIKGDITESYSFKWYELAINEEVKIARLFEYYMNSADSEKIVEALPRTVHLYFAHGNNLTYDKAALLYANLIKHESVTSELYAYYREDMKIFALQQLDFRRINADLRTIYRTVLKEDLLNIEQIKALYDITHTYQVTTCVENIRYIQVIRSDGKLTEKIPYTIGGAQVILYNPEDVLVWENINGDRYIGSLRYDTERLFYDKQFIDMCKSQLKIKDLDHVTKEELELNYDNLQQYGLELYELKKVLGLCSETIINTEFVADNFLVNTCYQLFKSEYYDKITMSYLVSYYMGATINMKAIWYAARDYEIQTHKFAEKIITQAVFSEHLFKDDEIFVDYYQNGAHFRLLKAYLALSAREYVMYNRDVSESIITIMVNKLNEDLELADIIKISVLKYFAYNSYDSSIKQLLKSCMQILCEKQMYFSFFKKYGEDWLREVQLWDKSLVAYSAKYNGQVTLHYRIEKIGVEPAEFKAEVLAPMFENIYVKKFLIFEDEQLNCYFEEMKPDGVKRSKTKTYLVEKDDKYSGKFGRLNDIINHPSQRDEKMKAYALEEALANRMFMPYE